MNRSRSTRKRNQDLELRLGLSELEKQNTLLTNQNIPLDNFIVVEDDDDEVQLSSSRIFGHDGVRLPSSRLSVQSRNGVSRRTIRVPAIREEDLELRLGLGGTSAHFDLVHIPSLSHRYRLHHMTMGPPIVPINISDDGDEELQRPVKKRKHGHPLNINDHPVEVKEVKEVKEVNLTCAICMDSMKEETSTICGHIFCRSCIVSAIQFQKKCPTCRRKLSMSNIHRIFLPGRNV